MLSRRRMGKFPSSRGMTGAGDATSLIARIHKASAHGDRVFQAKPPSGSIWKWRDASQSRHQTRRVAHPLAEVLLLVVCGAMADSTATTPSPPEARRQAFSTNLGDRSPKLRPESRPSTLRQSQISCVELVYVIDLISNISQRITDGSNMITAAQLRAARALAGLDQRKLAELSGLSLPTIQRMETSEDLIRGNVDSLTKLIAAFEGIGIEFLREGIVGSDGGRGVRFKKPAAARKPAELDEAADDAPLNREGG